MKILLLFLAFSVAAEGANATPYQELEKIYNSTNAPARLSDFDRLGPPSNMRCSGAKVTSPKLEEAGVPKTYEYVAVKGQPSQGPLSPGTPDQLKTVMMISHARDNPKNSSPTLDRLAALIGMAESPTDLIVAMTRFPRGVRNPGTLPLTLYFRKAADLIAMKAVLNDGRSTEEVQFFYCWREKK